MGLTAAALVPHPPLLIPELARGASHELDQLRLACRRAVGLTLDKVDALLVVGPAPSWGEADPGAIGSFAPYGASVTVRLPTSVPPEAAPPGVGAPSPTPAVGAAAAATWARPVSLGAWSESPATAPGGDWLDRRDLPPGRLGELPLSLAVAAWLLGQEAAARQLPRVAAFGVPSSMRVEQAAATGRALARGVRAEWHVGLLVMGDLSASRTAKAPAAFHPAAEEFDRQIGQAIRKAEIGRLLEADPRLAAELRAGGMPALWVLAGALRDAGELRGEVLYEAAPFGVGYLVGVIESR
jgi:hypothetical protein